MIRLTVEMVSYDHVALRWIVDPAPAQAVEFEIFRSGNAVTGFERVAATEGPVHLDILNLKARFRPVYYRVEAVIDGERVASDVVSIEAATNPVTQRLGKRERFQLAKYDGNPAWLFIKRQWGPKCPVCVTSTHGPAGGECPRCYNTGYDGGFFPPIPIYASFKRLTSERSSLAQTHVEQRDSNTLWMANWSIVSPEDLVVEAGPPNLVWIVEGVARSAYNRSPLSQTLTVNTVERGHVYYDLPRPTTFQWPQQTEIWFQSMSEGHKSFDDLWGERVAAYLATAPSTIRTGTSVSVPDLPPPVQVEPGDFDPFRGGFR